MSQTASAATTNEKLLAWVEETAELTQPDAVHWCDGSAEEYDRLCQELVRAGTFEKLSEAKRPNSYLARSDPGDVARVEDRTFICSEDESDSGRPKLARPAEMRETLMSSQGSIAAARCTVPFSMGRRVADRPIGGNTDSAYVAVSMRIMTRWRPALVCWARGQLLPCRIGRMPLEDGRRTVLAVQRRHSTRPLPETREIWSYGSSSAATRVGKKCSPCDRLRGRR